MKDTQLLKFGVGEPCPLPVAYGMEGMSFELLSGTWFAIVCVNRPSLTEIEAFKQDLEVGLFLHKGVMIFTLKTLSLNHVFAEAPFSYELCLAHGQEVSYIEEMATIDITQGAGCHLLLIDTSTPDKILIYQRMFAFTNLFTRTLIEAMAYQRENVTLFNPLSRDRLIQQLMDRHTTNDFHNKATITTRTGEVN